MPGSRRHRRMLLRAVLGTTIAAAAALPSAGAAEAAHTLLVPGGSGVTTPAGVAVTTNGSLWVTDDAMGVCRVDTADPPRLVSSQYCRPEAADGDPLATPRPGPGTAHQMAFDAASSNFFVAEGDSKGAGIWRMHWDAATDEIDFAQKIVGLGTNRVFALSLGSDAGGTYVDFNGRDDTAIRRLESADTAAAGASTTIVGNALAPGVASMANLDGALYLAEATGVTRIATPGPGAGAEPVAGLPAGAGAVPNALAADAANGRVYAGTANANAVDTVDVLTPGDGIVTTYESTFASITGLGLRPDGTLLIADDPPSAAGAVGTIGQSNVYEAPLHAAHLPTVTITSGPAVYSSATSVTFAFSSTFDTTFECSLDDPGAWSPCGSGMAGTQAYDGLADGTHTFEVRGGADGLPAKRVFTVDTIAPVASVDNPASDRTGTRDRLRIRVSANEFGVGYACELDGEPLTPCEPPVQLSGFAVGAHTFAATPTDLAGNTGDRVDWTFSRSPQPPPEPRPQEPDDPGSPPVPAPPVAAPAAATASSATPAAPRCRALVAPRRKGTFRLRGRVLTVRLPAFSAGRYVKLTLRPSSGFGRSQKLTTRRLSGPRPHTLRVVVSARQAARLRARRATIGAAYGTCATTVGAPHRLTTNRAKAR